jgi:gliding motility-associated protein GldM
MASGKMSPRQKMINMMYLVLLALLAMNVSAEILNAFENIEKKLSNSADNAKTTSLAYMDNMKLEIDEEVKNTGKLDNVKLKDTLDQIKDQTSSVIGLINKHITTIRDSIITVDPETGELLKKDETERNLQYWMGQGKEQEKNDKRGAGEAMKLRDKMNGYFEYLAKIYNSQVKDPKLKVEPRKYEDPAEGQDGKREKKSWERYTFEGPAIANMATLQALKQDVYEEEKKLLDLLNSRLGVATFKVDKVIPIDAPSATIVPAGLSFSTRLFVSMSSSQVTPKFSSGSGKIELEEGGNIAKLTMPASGSVIPQGKNEGRQSYSAVIQVPKATGGFESLEVKGEFTVRKPEIVITSAAVQNLYRNCGNDVNIDVPALGDAYNPKIEASEATVIPSKAAKIKFRIVPTGKTCNVAVNSITNGQNVRVGVVEYKVIEPPKPGIDMAVNGQRYNGASMVPNTSRAAIKLIPDADFASSLPADARYQIGSIDVLAQLTLGPPTKVNTVNSNGRDATKAIDVPLGTEVRQARPGTKVYIRINNIYRVNFENRQIEDKRFSEVERTLSLVIK